MDDEMIKKNEKAQKDGNGIRNSSIYPYSSQFWSFLIPFQKSILLVLWISVRNYEMGGIFNLLHITVEQFLVYSLCWLKGQCRYFDQGVQR